MPLELDLALDGSLVARYPASATSPHRPALRISSDPAQAVAQLTELLVRQRESHGQPDFSKLGRREAPTQVQLDRIKKFDANGRQLVDPAAMLAELGL